MPAKIAFVKRFPWLIPLFTASLFPLLLSARAYSAQPARSESGISESIKPDTVRIPNSSREKAAEPVRIQNSKTRAMPDSTELRNSDEPFMDREHVQNPAFISQTPVHASSPERVVSKWKVIAGAPLFGASYGIAILVASIMSTDGSSADKSMASYYYIPVVGPAIVGIKNYSASDGLPSTMLFFGWSIAEGMGLALLISGLVGTPAKAQVSEAPLTIEPLVMNNRTGLIMRMRF